MVGESRTNGRYDRHCGEAEVSPRRYTAKVAGQNGLIRFVAPAGQNAQLPQYQHFHVDRFIVAHESRAAPAVLGSVSFDTENDFGFVILARRVLDAHQTVLGIKASLHLVRPAGAPDAQVTHHGFLAGQASFPGHFIPLLDHDDDGFGELVPDGLGQSDGCVAVKCVPRSTLLR